MEKCYSHLSALEREEIRRGMATGSPIRAIARRLGRSPSTVCRELRRNAEGPERYLATAAQWRAQRRARIPRRRRSPGTCGHCHRPATSMPVPVPVTVLHRSYFRPNPIPVVP